MTPPPDNADVVAELRLRYEEFARCDRFELARALVLIAFRAVGPRGWPAVLDSALDLLEDGPT